MIKDSADMDTGMNREEDEGCYHGVIIREENRSISQLQIA